MAMTTNASNVNVNEIPADSEDSTLKIQYFFVFANGDDTHQSFNATSDVSDATRGLMATYGRGVAVKMAGGDDTVVGSAYGDTISLGDGTNHADGGDNAGTSPDGRKARDVLNLFIGTTEDPNAILVTPLDSNSTGSDRDAFLDGYRIKVVRGAETDFLKNIEQINVFRASDRSYVKTIALVADVNEAANPTSAQMHYAWVQGTQFGDNFTAASDLSNAIRTRMDTDKRGVYVDMGAGNDSASGSGFGDDFVMGSGVNEVDGLGNEGSTTWGSKAQDVLHVRVANAQEANAVTVTTLSGPQTDVNDTAAVAAGYTQKIVAGTETTYVRNVERISIEIASNNTIIWVRDVPLVTSVHEANLNGDISNFYHLAWVNGTDAGDTIDLSANTALLSAELKTSMGQLKRGVFVDGGKGNDIITGTAYADNFRNGAGDSRIDGGTQDTLSGKGIDVFEILVADVAAMNAVTVEKTAVDGYQWKVTGANGEVDYLKNIEAIAINVNSTNSGKWIPLTVSVHEAPNPTASMMHYASAQGTDFDDTFNAASDISSGRLAAMSTDKRGVYVDLGAGSDTATGSAYGDNFAMGSGVNYVDGGLNEGKMSWGGAAQDVLHIRVADAQEASAVTVVNLNGAQSTSDNAAFTGGYTQKIVAGNETTYVKNVERVSVEIASNNGISWVRDIPLVVSVHEANLSGDLSNAYHLAWVNGTETGDAIDLGINTTLLSTELKNKMAQLKRGVFVDGGKGNDTITGTAYSDNFRNGAGNSRIDGGTQDTLNGKGNDVFEILVDSSAEMNAIQVARTTVDGYEWMVTRPGGEVDYLKNIEAITIFDSSTNTGKWIPLSVSVHEAPNPTASMMHYASAQGTDFDDTFNAASDISSGRLAAMSTDKRGVYVDLGTGNDKATGTAYGDNFTMGSGVNHVDGGDNEGRMTWGSNAQDVVHVRVANAQEAAGVTVTTLSGQQTDVSDSAALAAGYTQKIVAGNETTYVKNVERISIEVASNNGYSWVRDIQLAVSVREADLSNNTTGNFYHLAWVNGTDAGDTIDLSENTTLLSTELKASMGQLKRGVFVDGGKGNDIITGTTYADNFRNGAGDSRIDGGTQDTLSGKGIDVFEILVADVAAMNAVTVEKTAVDGYQWKVTGANGEVDYLKNIEAITIVVNGSNTGKWIPLTVSVNEVKVDPNAPTRDTNGNLLSNLSFDAHVQGTAFADNFDAATLSQAAKDLMASNQRGIYADMGKGDDVFAGTAYGDNVVSGNGVNYTDGGTNGGTSAGGGTARDVLEIFVQTQEQANAIAVTALDASMTGVDGNAYANGYQFKISNGTASTDYVKNIETVNIQIWNDRNANGNRDYGTSPTDANNEVILARTISLVGTDAALSLGAIVAGQSISLNVADADANVNAGARDTVTVEVRNSTTNDIETVTLTETGNSTGVFAGLLASTNATAPGTSGDGSLKVGSGNQVTATYNDALTSTGAVNLDVTASRTATAGATGIISLGDVTAGQPVIITVNDLDLNTDANTAQSIAVQVRNSVTSETETVTLTETGNDTGVFSGNLITTHSPSAGTSGGGNLNVAAGQEIVASYTDALNANGETNLTASSSKVATAGTTGSLSMSNIIAGQVITVSLADADLNTNKATAQTLSLQLRNTTTNETETVTLIETGVDTGIFSGSMATTNASGAGQNGDSNLNVASGNTVSTTYTDAIVSSGAVNQVTTATRTVAAGTTGTISMSGVTAGQPVTVTVTDADLNDNAGSMQTVSVQVRNATTNEVETITLTETGNNTGIFSAILSTVASSAADASGNGSINVTGGNTIIASYIDALAADGSTAKTVSDSRQVGVINSAPTFATPSGVAHYDAGVDMTVVGGIVLADGKSLALSSLLVSASSDGRAYQAVLSRTNPDGTVDTTFGSNGSATLLSSLAGGGLVGPALQGDKIVIAVGSAADNSSDIRVMRFDLNGAPDASFGTSGSATIAFGPGRDSPVRMIVLGEKIVVAGIAHNGSNNDFGVVRLNSDGSPDTSFNGNGKLVLNLGTGNDNVSSVIAQADGKLLIVGRSLGPAGNNDVSIVRVNDNGTLDTTFNASGKLLLPIGQNADTGIDVKLQSDNKIVIVGGARSSSDNLSDFDQAIVRLNADGSPDNSFGTNGIVQIHATGKDDFFYRLQIQSDGKLVVLGAVGGETINNTPNIGAELIVRRFLADGSVDTGFGINGSVKLPGRGIADQASSLRILENGKILIQGNVSNDTSYSNAILGVRLNDDGSLDTTFNPAPASSINGSVRVDGVHAKALDTNAAIYDAELSATGSYAGATLALARNTGANAEDVFVGMGEVSFANGVLTVDGISIGSVTNANGSLALTFNEASTQGLVNRALHGIGYTNTNAAPSASLTLKWTFSDGNVTNAQGLGGAASATGTTTVEIGAVVGVVRALPADPSLAYDTGLPLAQRNYLASVSGTRGADSFDASTSSQITDAGRALMASVGRGVFMDMGAGNDTVTGTGFGDLINVGAGVNYVDGGAHVGTTTSTANNGKPLDILEVTVATPEEAAAVTVVRLDGTGTDSDKAAFQNGYKIKVTNGAEIDYIRNVEAVDIKVWKDLNGNGSREYTGDINTNEVTFVRRVPLNVSVYEIQVSSTDPENDISNRPLSSINHFANANGSLADDSFNAATDVSVTTNALMTAKGRGVSVYLGGGNDTAVGSAYGDRFNLGNGTNHVDGLANEGSEPNGRKATDILEVLVSSLQQGDAVTASLLVASSGNTADDAAYSQNYKYKVQNGADVHYVKNIEAVHIMQWVDADNNGQQNGTETTFLRSIPLALELNEILVGSDPSKDSNGNPLSNAFHMAWVNGTDADENFDANASLSQATKGLMTTYGRGMFIDMGGGNDTAKGTAYGDNFVAGAGMNYLDGGANAGTQPSGNNPAMDMLEIFVTSQAEADELEIVELNGNQTATDNAALGQGYLYKVITKVGTDYVKNIEHVNIQIWDDKDGDRQRDYSSDSSVNEVTHVRNQSLSQTINAAPTFGTPAGVAIYDSGTDFVPAGSVTLPNGQIMVLSYFQSNVGGYYTVVLTRFNADGTGDSLFNPSNTVAPTSRTVVNTDFYGMTNLVRDANGKLLFATGTTQGAGSDFRVYRLNADGTPDTTFGNGGSQVIPVSGNKDMPSRLALATDGGIIVAGTSNDNDFAVARLNADGSVDAAFGNGGSLVIDVGNASSDVLLDMLIQADGSILMAGRGRMGETAGTGDSASSNTDFALVRITASGQLDTGFNGGGKHLVEVGPGIDVANSVVALPNGQFMVAGFSRTGSLDNTDGDLSLVRFNSNGSVDTDFGNNGKVFIHATNQTDRIYKVLLQSDGKLLIAGVKGTTGNGYGGEAFVGRLNDDGSFDGSFGEGGMTRLPLRGVFEQISDLRIADGKILFVGATAYETSFVGSSDVMVRLNLDGTIDTSFASARPTSLELSPAVTTDGVHVALIDRNVSVFDPELWARRDYGGSAITLARQGGANAGDVFVGYGEVRFTNDVVTVAGIRVGTVAQSGGQLTMTFDQGAQQGMVNRAIHGIGYTNVAGPTSGQITLAWTFSDGNAGSQGIGGSKTAVGTSRVTVEMIVGQTALSSTDPANRAADGSLLTSKYHLANVSGTAADEIFNVATSTVFNTAMRTAMDQNKRGVFFDMGPGNDKVTGSAYGDNFILGTGTNFVDGGADEGTDINNHPALDVLEINVANQAAADSVQFVEITADMTGDAAAYAEGYRIKVINGAEVDYIKNIENVDIKLWNDKNNNGRRDFSNDINANEVTTARHVSTVMHVNEIQVHATEPGKDAAGNPLASSYHFAWANGTPFGDSFDAATGISQATRDLMAANQRGVSVDLGAGNDTAVGSSFGDRFNMGSGTNYVDGGANIGADINGQRMQDILEILVTSEAAADAVSVVVLNSSMIDVDRAAFDAGYTHKVINGTETDYVKDIESVHVMQLNDTNSNGQQDGGENMAFVRAIPLVMTVNEINTSSADPADSFHFAWVNGVGADETFDAASLSAATKTAMAQFGRGIYVDMGGGDDTAIGSAYGDNFVSGAGVNHIDGGAQDGSTPWAGGTPEDALEVYVADETAANAIRVVGLTDNTADMADKDLLAFNAGYHYKVVTGQGAEYVKNIESVNVQIWNDLNNNGHRDMGGQNNEVTWVRNFDLSKAAYEIQINPSDPTQDAQGNPLSNSFHLAWANGDGGDNIFNAATLSQATKLLMSQYQRGMYFNTMDGNDLLTGSSYGDNFEAGNGINYIDGGRNLGTPNGFGARDVVEMFVADQAAANNVSVMQLNDDSLGEDAIAFGMGYLIKVVNGAEINYIKNIEAVDIKTWNDKDSDQQRDYFPEGDARNEVVTLRSVATGVSTSAIPFSQTDANKAGDGVLLVNKFTLTNAIGSSFDDSYQFSMSSFTAEAQTKMATYQRGVYVDMRGGNDIVTGSQFGDFINTGSGINYVDGGGNLGQFGTFSGRDIVEVIATSTEQAKQVRALLLDDTATGEDKIAFDAGFQYMVTNGADVTYLKNVELVRVNVWTDQNGNQIREGNEVTLDRNLVAGVIADVTVVNSADATKDTNNVLLTDKAYFATVDGSVAADFFDASSGFLSSSVQQLMNQYGRGVNVRMGAGNDTVVGSGYGDLIRVSGGVNYVDGGANAGTDISGNPGKDVLTLIVTSDEQAAAVTATLLTGDLTGLDSAAAVLGYTHKVTNGLGETDYLRNIEVASVQKWTDADSDNVIDAGELVTANMIDIILIGQVST